MTSDDRRRHVASALMVCALVSCTPSKDNQAAAPWETKASISAADLAGIPADAQKSATGLATKVLAKGTGTERPSSWDKVTVMYTGWSRDGKVVEATTIELKGQKLPNPVNLALTSAMPGFREALQQMVVGEKRRLWIPPELTSQGIVSANGMLVYDLQLLGIDKMVAPHLTFAEFQTPPTDAQKTASGLVSRVLKAGTGTTRPGLEDFVTVRVGTWKMDGSLLGQIPDRPDGPPAVFQVQRAGMKGLVEGVLLMVPGETRQFWIPGQLGVEVEQPNMPRGPLFVELEMLEIVTPEPPKDLRRPPTSAEKITADMVSVVERKGTGSAPPGDTDGVLVKFNLWSPDGKLLETTLNEGGSQFLRVDRMNPDWQEVVKRMVEGELRRTWISNAGAKVAGLPKGTLVLDTELIEIVRAAPLPKTANAQP